jgi:hypothetical protein
MIMNDIDGSTRSENGENAGIIKTSSVRGVMLDLEAESESVSIQVCQVIRRVMYLGPVERWTRASGVGDAEGVLWEGVQDPPRIVEELEGAVTSVGHGRGDLQVLQSIDVDVGGRGLESQAGCGRDSDHGSDEDDEGIAEGRGHRNAGSEGNWQNDPNETLGLNEPGATSPLV